MFSIIIPSLNEGYYLNITLDSIYNHVDSDLLLDIVIVDDFSDDQDLSFIEKHPLNNKINLIKNNYRKGPSASRNIGAENASGDILIFIDAHMYLENVDLYKIKDLKDYLDFGAIQGSIGSFSDKSVIGSIYTIKDNLLNSTWVKPLLDNFVEDDYIIETPCSAGGFTIIKKEIFNNIGGFNRLFNSWGAEDLDISIRLWLRGYKIYFTNKLFLAHYFKKSFNYEVDSKNVLYNKYIMYKLFFEGVYDNTDSLIESFIKFYGEDNYNEVKTYIDNNYQVSQFVLDNREKFKFDINWYLKKFKDYISLDIKKDVN